jgi:glycosyltransferase involved in cell wall biosynthesis
MSSTINITAIILAHRYDQRLLNAIDSAQFAAEILIVDNNSNTPWNEIMQSRKFEIISELEPVTDWSAIRNKTMNRARHEWVLFLDSDEVLSSNAAQAVAKIVEANFFDGALVKRSDIFHDKKLQYGEAGNQSLVRIGKKNRMQFHRPVHEEAHVNGLVSTTDIEILHNSHLTIQDFFDSICAYAHREAKHRHDTGHTLFLPTMIVFPIGKFLLNYVFKLGFLDGWQGFIYAFMMSLHSFFVRVYHYELQLNSHE